MYLDTCSLAELSAWNLPSISVEKSQTTQACVLTMRLTHVFSESEPGTVLESETVHTKVLICLDLACRVRYRTHIF